MESVTGLLYSQVGYDRGERMTALVRGSRATLPDNGATFQIFRDGETAPVLEGEIDYWGETWGSAWWLADFSALAAAGNYVLAIRDGSGERFRSAAFPVGDNWLWRQTWRYVALDQSERRARLARDHVGWYDAGAEWQEADSHAALLVGLCDVLEFAAHTLTPQDRTRLEAQIVNGCDYLARLQDRADTLPGGAGAVVHQIWKHDSLMLFSDASKAALAWARAAQLLSETHAEKRADYLARAQRAYAWLATARPCGAVGFAASNHGAPPAAPVPEEWMTRDLLMQLWAAFALAQAGLAGYREECTRIAGLVLARQVRQDTPEGVYYGHFRTFDSAEYTEKAWIHNGEGGVLGSDIGGHFPHYVLPLLLMREAWHDDADAPRWEQAVRDFAYGYFLPACRANPFQLLPLGYFTGQGLLSFAGLWHGMNAAYGLAAALGMEFARFFDDRAFRDLAVGNLQWIAGLNAGVTAESLFASHMFSMDIPAGVALPCSMIQGIGANRAGSWMQIRGAICNGFSVGDQFTYDVVPTVAADGPHAFTDEDWISHAGGWLSALARFQQSNSMPPT